ncbi:SLAP domain-containing protein [Lactobacillus sp. ESL0679]|uniref:SLAP domain-containing protein n=1 Tax=Lactobacillus sp. ESL0679 TaxID=2983209 RepID=UPI0023F8B569|nr:SLAP domain-containing protein [Lactobacillus sp. ESL0679]MDF7683599.1 SLAP domain-containing protein [Lactobacillus sp. ESL0679]
MKHNRQQFTGYDRFSNKNIIKFGLIGLALTSLVGLSKQTVSAETTAATNAKTTQTATAPKAEVTNIPTKTNDTDDKPVVRQKLTESFDPVEKTLVHNAFLYNQDGKRANDVTMNAGSTVETYGTTLINNRKFYNLKNQLYIAAGNIDRKTRELARDSYIYDQNGNQGLPIVLAKDQYIPTFGDPVRINGTEYYLIDQNQYIKKGDLVEINPTPQRPGDVDGLVINGVLKHKAYIYDKNGKRTNKLILKIGTKCYAAISETINGKQYYEFDHGRKRILAANIDGTKRTLTHNSYLYNKHGKRIGHKVLSAKSSVRTYGSSVLIKGQRYYIVDNNRYIKRANF